MAGVLLTTGQNHIVDLLFLTNSPQNYYLGLMEQTSNPSLDSQLGAGMTEVTGLGYARILLTRGTGGAGGDWARSASIATAAQKTFTIGTGGWTNCNGYFVATNSSGNGAIWAEAFPGAQQGSRLEGDTIRITARYEQKDNSE